ncbi:alpha/beta hydrolase [Idiomarina xiamenensis]|uniref:Hydrolase with alpha/beta fold protein n=1 Tax=Idiomarina xiamenensis 10-D-4 TaxID=740709 RepID=K2LCG9_9GAMM|nr:alpha/beta fold hydrolase [Idiomarina xiamenensis]EKE87575.1 hydrolase with alpha/beta fold protein [Idiomarina xiamenensis 10-D-4]
MIAYRGFSLLRSLIAVVIIALLGYAAVIGYYYGWQERELFKPTLLASDYVYDYEQPFEESYIAMPDGVRLHSLLFRTQKQRQGVVFYLHGNRGSLVDWAKPEYNQVYLDNGYDLFMVDYRGYGKSAGEITSESQLYGDVAALYRWLLQSYQQQDIVVVGYSLGSGPAAWLACRQQPRYLVLKAPYYSMVDLAAQIVPYIPSAVLRYPLRTDKALSGCQTPITLIHGEQDKLIPIDASERLAQLLKADDQFIRLAGVGHGNLAGEPSFIAAMDALLKSLNQQQQPSATAQPPANETAEHRH